MANMEQAIQAILAIQATSGTKAKLDIVRANAGDPDFKSLLWYAFHPGLTYNVSEQTLSLEVEAPIETPCIFNDIFNVCDFLAARKAADAATVWQVVLFLRKQPPAHRVVYTQLLAKTLRIGLTAKNINKAIPDLIPEWEVQQAFPIDKYPLKLNTWFALTQKLNGVRATYYNGQMIGRSGIPLHGLEHITFILDNYANYVFDGELTLANTAGISDNEAFRIATGVINSEQLSKPEIIFTVFDMIPIDQFDGLVPVDSYRKRRAMLNHWGEKHSNEIPVKVLPLLYSGTDQSRIPVFLDQMVQEDKEGLMVNLDVPYQRKRHRGILKVKRFYTMDLPILRCEKGAGKLSETLGALVVDYAGTEVGVGSGFTDEQRTWFWSHREDVIGQLAEVKYKDISTDKQTGKQSLQFPVFVSLRTDKTDVSYG